MHTTDFIIENGVLTKYKGPGGDVVIPDGVTKIGDCAFFACQNLTNAYIPDSVTKIGESAFAFCKKLTLCAPAGSYAETYAKENGIPFHAL